MKYRCIVADPPWQYAEKVTMSTSLDHKGPATQYELMGLDEIKALPVSEWAETKAHRAMSTQKKQS
jgi:N6-adenosine-specific RNA methylase IME4